MNKLAIITGADGGMGTEITRSVAKAGYRVIMVCRTIDHGSQIAESLRKDTGNEQIAVKQADFTQLQTVKELAEEILAQETSIDLLMNNAGVLCTDFEQTVDGFEKTISVNYLGAWLLTNKLVPLMHQGTRVVNQISLTYAIGKYNDLFFAKGGVKHFNRFAVYGNSKMALWTFTTQLAERLKDKGIAVNASDPWIVSTKIIRLQNKVIDTLCDLFFRPVIYTPAQGAATAIHLLLSEQAEGISGKMYASCKCRKLSSKWLNHPQAKQLWQDTEKLLNQKNLY